MDIKDINFLKKLNENRNKSYYARISILNMAEEVIQSIEGRVLPGSSVSIAGNSSVRRTCSLNLIADKEKNDLTDVENLLSVNKKIKIYVGLEKDLDYLADIIYLDNNGYLPQIGEQGKIYISRQDFSCKYWNGSQYNTISSIFDYQKDIIWFPMGVYVIIQPNIINETTNCNISLTCKDKMSLLNGELGGNLPTSVTFHEYDQVIGNIDVYYNEAGPAPWIGDLISDPNEYNVYTYHYNYNKETWDKKYRWTKKYGWSDITIPDNDNKDFYSGAVLHIRNLIYDVIQTAVANFGNESLAKIIINDIPKEIKQIVRYTGTTPLYYNTATNFYTLDENYIIASQADPQDTWRAYQYNDDIGYVYTDFVFPDKESIITNIGDNVCTVLDKIVNLLGNYEYFYDIDGNFVFQEKRNYLNNSYNPTKDLHEAKSYYLDNNKDGVNGGESIQMSENNLKLIGKENYKVDYYSDQKSVYTFNQGNGLITSYNNTPNYTNLKNDYHIWGKNANNNNVIHYHIAIKRIPKKTVWNAELNAYTYREREVVFLRDKNNYFTGRIRMLNKDDFIYRSAVGDKHTITFINKNKDNTPVFSYDSSDHSFHIDKTLIPDYTKSIVMSNIDGVEISTGEKKQLGVSTGLDLVQYTPNDWRAELYLQGLEAIQQGKRPDIYQQEILDLFDSIYEWGYYDDNGEWHFTGRFKTETVYNPNNLNYWIDYLEPVDNFYGVAVDTIEPKIYSYQQDKIIKIYSDEIPNCVIIDEAMDNDYQQELREKCEHEGQPRSTVDGKLYKTLVENTKGYSAQEVARNLLYQYTTYNEVISLQSIPIYYLDVNTRITVEDRQSGISGDYIINSINIPLSPTSAMSISASRALNRI